MNNGSNEQDLPPLTSNAIDAIGGLLEVCTERENQLREALAQVATLTTQVEELGADRDTLRAILYAGMQCAKRAEAELITVRGAMASQDSRQVVAGMKCGVFYSDHGCDWPDTVADEVLRLDAELAALRKGAKVTHLMREECDVDPDIFEIAGIEEFSRVSKVWEPHGKKFQFIERTVITRERILDADGGEG